MKQRSMLHEWPLAEAPASSRQVELAELKEFHTPNESTLSILLVEDDPSHAEIARRNLLRSSIIHRLIHVEDGQAALDYLKRKNRISDFASESRPDLILLDLNMPKMGGIEVLRRIQENSNLNRIPIVVMTTSSATVDISAAHRLGASGYLTKPVSPECFTELLHNYPSNVTRFSIKCN